MSVVVSAPGKVLIAGGYLVLDPKYSGVAISTSSRFYTVIRKRADLPGLIHVRAPQFANAEWGARVCVGDDDEIILEDVDSSESCDALSNNKFVLLAIHKVLYLILEMKGKSFLQTTLLEGLDITIVGHNDFYSQRHQLKSRGLPPTLDSLAKLPSFAPTNGTLRDVHKTGLGSSAALITSLVTALLVHFSAISPQANDEGRALAHNVAQYVHCLAQGKVGSGFDVSAAIFGSHVYTRFNPSVIEPLMRETENPPSLLRTLSPLNPEWNQKVQPFRLPPMMRLLLGDVDAGSSTPALVSKVLHWRQTRPTEANELWDKLSAANQELASVLTALCDQHEAHPETYAVVLERASDFVFSEWEDGLARNAPESEVAAFLIRARTVSQLIRGFMREMGTHADVPIEPSQPLIDACLSQRGVVAGGVPGAGGYDAIWLLLIEPQIDKANGSPVAHVEKVFSSWKDVDVSPLSADESREGGVRVERLEAVPGLLETLD